MMVLLSAAVNGVGSALNWTASGEYISKCASDENRGFFFSFFFFMYMSSQIVGSIIAAVVLQNSEMLTLHIVMSIVMLVGCLLFLLLKNPTKRKSDIIQNGSESNNDSQSMLESPQQISKRKVVDKNNKSSSIFTSEFDQNKDLTYSYEIQNKKSQSQFKKDIIDTFRLLKSKCMIFMIPFQLLVGISQSLYIGAFMIILTNSMVDKGWDSNKQLSMSFYAMIPLGVGELIGSIIIGNYIDKYGHKATIIPCLISLVVACTLVICHCAINQFTILAYFMTFFWGVFDSFINNLMNCMLGFEFESNNTPYSVSTAVWSTSFFIVLILEAQMSSNFHYLILLTCSLVYGIISLAILSKFKFKSKQ
ncbi:major facilitator superfamily protein [Stylonychia lemnae]|uniref:Major facilitator superfamily protein n=1 Tax=Stylonychia lemnae TaxID=5949 RepID=A0A077ZPX2_STYLE|nr:major facilitator superfamily protein [Stylonychia lemnae]|eukprot:CDW71948.1 major facilitator superfamily protein [Stylonychia lemnae]